MNRNIVAKLTAVYQRETFPGMIRCVMHKAARAVFHTNSALWMARELQTQEILNNKECSAHIILDGGSSTLEWIKRYGEPWMYNEREIFVAERAGHLFPLVVADGKGIGYMKIALKEVYIGDYQKVIAIPGDVAFIYDTYIHPSYRGKGIAPHLITQVAHYFAQQGYRRIMCHIPPWNTASVRAYSKTGFRQVRHVRFVSIVGIPFISIKEGRLWK